MLRSSHRCALGIVLAAALTLPDVARAQVPLTILHSFAASTADGGSPEAALVQGADGNFYGTTYQGGTFGQGTIFRMTAAGAMTVLHSFAGNPADGAHPTSSLVQTADGNFYGTTRDGGALQQGTTFKMTPAGVVTILHSFGGNPDGASPSSELVEGSDGNLYGTTFLGGVNGGTVFRMTPAGAVTVLHAFAGPEGWDPSAGLLEASDGNFYGTAYDGGAFNEGTVFRMTPAGVVTLLHSFARGASDGGRPRATLIQATDGNLYGTTFNGGVSELGTIFRMTLAGSFTLIHSFAGGAGDGMYAWAGVIQGSDGNLYGTTEAGGPFDNGGTVYKITLTGQFVVLHAFARGTQDGASGITALVQAADGSFYGTALQGGLYEYGVAFRFNAISCIDRLSLHYTSGPPSEGGTLDVGFTVYSAVPATWSLWLFYAGGSNLWSVPMPAVSPAVVFTVPFRGFPAIGPVAVFAALSTQTQGVLCGDLKVVNTGAP
jgi:uncharacterized repeat protein (TIGR03803 family)